MTDEPDDLIEVEQMGQTFLVRRPKPAPSERGLDAERRLYVLTRLLADAHSEMPERMNNAVRVRLNLAYRYARREVSSGETRALEAEYDRALAAPALSEAEVEIGVTEFSPTDPSTWPTDKTDAIPSWAACDDCGRADGTHDPEVEH